MLVVVFYSLHVIRVRPSRSAKHRHCMLPGCFIWCVFRKTNGKFSVTVGVKCLDRHNTSRGNSLASACRTVFRASRFYSWRVTWEENTKLVVIEFSFLSSSLPFIRLFLLHFLLWNARTFHKNLWRFSRWRCYHLKHNLNTFSLRVMIFLRDGFVNCKFWGLAC